MVSILQIRHFSELSSEVSLISSGPLLGGLQSGDLSVSSSRRPDMRASDDGETVYGAFIARNGIPYDELYVSRFAAGTWHDPVLMANVETASEFFGGHAAVDITPDGAHAAVVRASGTSANDPMPKWCADVGVRCHGWRRLACPGAGCHPDSRTQRRGACGNCEQRLHVGRRLLPIVHRAQRGHCGIQQLDAALHVAINGHHH